MGKWLSAGMLVFALTACSGGGEIRYATLSGELVWPETITLPPGAQAHIALRVSEPPVTLAAEPVPFAVLSPVRWIGVSGEVVARDTIEIAGAQPIPFTLRYNRDAADPSRALAVDAWITAGEQVLFAVTASPRVRPGSAAIARVTLRRPNHVAFACADGSRFSAAIPALGELAFLEADGGRPVSLRAEPAAGGFHYAGDGYSLRGRADAAMLHRPSGEHTACAARRP